MEILFYQPQGNRCVFIYKTIKGHHFMGHMNNYELSTGLKEFIYHSKAQLCDKSVDMKEKFNTLKRKEKESLIMNTFI
jgi:hypothetical protein